MADDNRAQGLAWFLAGIGVGALIGILYAPKSGRETREEIAQGAREGTEYLRAKSKQAAQHVGTLVDKGKEQLATGWIAAVKWSTAGGRSGEEFVERGKSLVGDQTTRVAAAVDAGRESVSHHSDDRNRGVVPISANGAVLPERIVTIRSGFQFLNPRPRPSGARSIGGKRE